MAFAYLHSLDGRMRIKIPRVRGSAENAARIEAQLVTFPGIDHVRANPTTGNVLILYTPADIAQRDILRALRRLRWLDHHGQARHREGRGVGHRAAENAIAVVLELALQRLCI
jgi:hypothetical protein